MFVPELLAVVEAAYRVDLESQAWLDHLRATVGEILDGPARTFVGEYHLDQVCGFTIPRFSVVPELADFAHQAYQSAEPAHRVGWIKQPVKHGGQYEVLMGLNADAAEVWRALPKPPGIADFQFTQCLDGGDRMVMISSFSDRLYRRVDRRPEAAFLAAHVAAGMRVRQRLGAAPLERADGILAADGRLIHGDDRLARARDKLREALGRRQRARAHGERLGEVGRLALWDVLVDGTWSLIEYVDTDAKRLHILVRNAPAFAVEGDGALTERERRVARLAGQGVTNAAIAYGLGIGATSVANALRSALSKLGLRRRTDLPWVVGSSVHRGAAHAMTLGEDVLVWSRDRAAVVMARLTEAERAVVDAVVAGLSDAEIAASRGTSARTVANQVRAISAKLGVSGRVEIVAAVADAASSAAPAEAES